MYFTLKNTTKIITALLLGSSLSACSTKQINEQGTPNKTIETINATSLVTQKNIQGSQGSWIANNTWLVTSESNGLLLVNDQTKQSQPLKAGNFESLSVRQLANDHFLFATIDNERDNVAIFTLKKVDTQWQLTELNRIISPQAQPEAACLFTNKDTQTISVFVPDARGLVQEVIVYDNKAQRPLKQPMREFAGISETAGCAVNDTTQTLFISESEVGIWAVNANAESRADKKPLALVAPFGELKAEINALFSATDGSLWFTSTSNNSIYQYIESTEVMNQWQVNSNVSLESVSVHFTNDNYADLLMYDDEEGGYLYTKIAATAMPIQDKKNHLATVHASAQTDPVQAFGDAADDPAIWVHPKQAEKSLILGTDKRRGLMVYNLQGKELQALEIGRLNNVDVRQHPSIKNTTNTFITASNRSSNSISVFTVTPDNTVQYLNEITTNLSEIYGMCMYSSLTGNYVFVNDKSGLYQQYKITTKDSQISGELVREFNLPSQPEGCSADDKNAQLFMGEEDAGIWFINAEPNSTATPVMLQKINAQLVDDVEGMEIYHTENERLLVVSSQGDNTYVVYKITVTTAEPNLQLVGKFAIVANLQSGLDGTSETDGLTVTAQPLPNYPQGVLIVQDGYNRMPQQPQNFKIVDWREVEKVLKK